MKNSGRHISMDAPLVEGEDSNLYDVIRSNESPNPDKELILASLRTEIERALETLTPREADVIRLYFWLRRPTRNDPRGNRRNLRPYPRTCTPDKRKSYPTPQTYFAKQKY